MLFLVRKVTIESKMKTNPLNYYGFTKLEGEKIVKSSNLSYLIARASVIYGSRTAGVKLTLLYGQSRSLSLRLRKMLEGLVVKPLNKFADGRSSLLKSLERTGK